MKMSNKSNGLILILIFFVLLGGCGKKDTSSVNRDSANHYVENEIIVPDSIIDVNDVAFLDNGDILLSEVDDSDVQGNLWKYSEESQQWEKKLILTELVGNQVPMDGLTLSTQINKLGEILCIVKPKDDNSKEATRFFLVDENQNIKELTKLKDIVKEKKINTITFYDSKFFIATNFDGNSYLINSKTEDIQTSFQVGSGMIQSITGDDKKIILLTGDHKIKTYDINSGKQIENKSETYNKLANDLETGNGNYGKSDLLKAGSEFYLVNGNGVMKYKNKDKSIILSGNNTIFGNTDSLLIKSFKNESNQDISAWINESEKNKIYKYKYSKNEIKKNETITVYSIYENKQVRNMINKYSRGNTNINVNYIVGIDDKGTKTESEAIKNLNTEILSNNSPDVIILDGLDEKSYIEKDLLSDISSLINNELLIPAATEGYKKEDKIYALAMKIAMPIFAQKDNTLSGVNNVKNLVSQLEATQPFEGINILDPASRYNTMSVLYRMSFNEKNNINKNSLRDFYKTMQDINVIEQKGIKNPEGDGRDLNDISATMFSFEVYNTLLSGEALYGFDYLTSIESLRESVYFNKVSINTTFIEDENGIMYVPESIIAIPKNTNKKDKAKEFLKEIMSKEYQVSNSYDGISTNVEAIQLTLESLEPRQISIDNHNHTEEDQTDGNSINNFNLQVLSKDEQISILKMIQEAKSMSVDDVEIKKLVFDEGKRILENKISVNEAVKVVSNKIEIFNSEK